MAKNYLQLNKTDFEAFKKHFIFWQKKLNFLDFDCHFIFQILEDDAQAEFQADGDSNQGKIILNKRILNPEHYKGVEYLAKHEAIHVFLWKITRFIEVDRTHDPVVLEEEERVVTILEKLL